MKTMQKVNLLAQANMRRLVKYYEFVRGFLELPYNLKIGIMIEIQ